ncbi:uncharacterized protein LOC131876559 [Cryptomeria japonica]|uniref:uncharacterized protein LOC131876559 n=1 Tax=Cryptomeria japonica TaxID=3369 RepID=UPI0027DA1E90|nr:uncharacterized protein LOC131876559 [Cryptomeria japonica]
MGDMSYRELSNQLAKTKEALDTLKGKYKDSLSKRRDFAEQLMEFTESNYFDEENTDALVNEVEKLNDDKANVRRELESLTIRMSQELEARRTTEDKIREKEHEIFKLNLEIGTLSASIHKRRNYIKSIKDETGQEISENSLLGQNAVDFFTKLYVDGGRDSPLQDCLVSKLPMAINEDDNRQLLAPISTDEVHMVVFVMGAYKTPGPDGFPPDVLPAGGGVIRDHLGNMVVAYVGNLRDNTVTQDEGMALLWGLKMANSIGIKHLEIEGDSQIIIDSTKGNALVGWRVEPILRDIRCFLVKMEDFTICHIFIEGNRAADSIAAEGRLQNGL